MSKSTDFRHATFLTAAHQLSQCPPDEGREVAFVGRSNAGKSSALNAMSGRKDLARTSKQPGRTQQLVYFDLGNNRRLVDLPGYGFARVPIRLRQHWDREMNDYFHQRESLVGLVLPVDIRRLPGEMDLMILRWCDARHVPVRVLLTKADKLSRGKAMSELALCRNRHADLACASFQLFSATKFTGVDELRELVGEWLND